MTKAFLIGAGATRAQYPNSPLCGDFFKKLLQYNKQLYVEIENTLRQYLSGSWLHDLNVEDVMEMSYDLPQSIQTSFLGNLYIAIYGLLVDSTKSNAQDIRNALSRETRDPHTLFNKLLRDPRLDKKDFFMTLNYDLYLVREILSIQNFVNYEIDDANIQNSMLPINSTKMDFSLYHLHGALNWELVSENKIRIHHGPINPWQTRTGANIYLIPPGKKEFYPILKTMWKKVEKRLIKADELIIIGCSLNPKDSKLINLVQKFIKYKGTKNVKIIYKDIKGSKDLANYIQIFGSGFKSYPHGFILNGPSDGAIEFILK